ncbi:(2E,6E)-farnesyl diphosphate synthase [Sulfuriflexus mobilis]|uniref:(2E,6E)-farnesyl diphosphate synthase n=1 Tax=Sulfuriflexus mobilis TaxID=1811807 RepID=UPI001E54CF7A|nr:farnesyl diphosphate synthase [Sulfuriflexus mobilis]
MPALKTLTQTTENPALQPLMQTYQARTETVLGHWLPTGNTHPAELHAAMRYSVLGGGKRVRAVLVYLTGQALGIPLEQLDGPASTVELIHAYSLIHDDLPAMDDDDLRRGKPTCHKAFNEAIAVLAGDALHSLAFHILAHDPAMQCAAASRLMMVDVLARAIGSRGMAGGQAIDLASEGKTLSLPELENMHIHKTGALIRASVQLGCLSGEYSEAQYKALDHYAEYIGLAFQIRDDILDVEADTATLGKAQGADIARDKSTYPSLLGMAEAKKMAQQCHTDALQAIAGFDEKADPLRWLSAYIIERGH